MRHCVKCLASKPLDEFYKNPGMKDGYLNQCIACVRASSRAKRIKNLENPEWAEREAERQRQKQKQRRLRYGEKIKPSPEAKRGYTKKYWGAFPEKRRANWAVRSILIPGLHAHHWSYSNCHLKDVIYLQPEHHYLIHRFIQYDKQRLMYQSKGGELLDTKDKHVRFINRVLKENGIEPYAKL